MNLVRPERGVSDVLPPPKSDHDFLGQSISAHNNNDRKSIWIYVERSTIEVIHLLRQLIKKYREQKQHLHMVFVDLRKTYYKLYGEF